MVGVRIARTVNWERGRGLEVRAAALNKVPREGVTEETALEQRPSGEEAASHTKAASRGRVGTGPRPRAGACSPSRVAGRSPRAGRSGGPGGTGMAQVTTTDLDF